MVCAAPIEGGVTESQDAQRTIEAEAAAWVVLLAAGLGAVQVADPLTALRADHRTAPGEIRAVSLPDGSTAELGSDSAIAVAFDDTRRAVRLLRGEAVFTVAAAAGAFAVTAAGGEARALGTRFLVRTEDDAADVAVLLHSVAVTPPDTAGRGEAVVLTEGQAVGYSRTGLGPVRTVDPARVAAWRRGRIVFDGAPLAKAVAELSRYRRGRILVLDPALAARRVSGVFRIDDIDGAVAMIAAELGARAVALPPFLTALY